jgi:hypothetical protein
MKVFKARLKISQECDDELDEDKVRQWLEEFFDGCDLGTVTVAHVEEIDDDD